MKKTSEDISKKKERIKKSLLILIIFLILIGVYIYNTTYYVIVRFDQLGPLTKNMSAYYNGFKVGKIVRIEADKDFKHTLVKVNLFNKDINLPQNSTVNVQKFPNGELYLQFIYPNSPVFRTIKRGDILEGIAPYNLEEFMLGQNIAGVTDVVSQQIIKTLNATEIANIEIKIFFQNSSRLINENRKGINTSVNNTVVMTRNLAQAAENLNQTSKKLNNALDETTLKDTTSNIRETTDNVSKATKDIDKIVKKIDDTISQANAAAGNLNSITSGLNETLGKRCGGMRVMFGTPVKPQNCKRNDCR